MSCFFNIACPPLPCLVRAEFLHDGDGAYLGQYERGIAHRVVLAPGHALRFMVVTERGALFHGLPIHALCLRECEPLPLHVLSLWNCMSFHAAVYKDPWRSGLDVQVKLGDNSVARGEAVMSVDYVHAEPQLTDGGWSMLPDEHKEHNVIALESGHLAAMPGNRIIWLDASYVSNPWDLEKDRPSYKTNTKTWSVEGNRSVSAGGEMFYDVAVSAEDSPSRPCPKTRFGKPCKLEDGHGGGCSVVQIDG
jgi:hypothetical protein